MSLQAQTEVLEWLLENHPQLHANAELDREWIWLPVDLRGEHNKAVRESIGRKGVGFIFCPKGHPLPSGQVGTWAHHCTKPIPFKRRGSKLSTTKHEPIEELSAEEAAFFS